MKTGEAIVGMKVRIKDPLPRFPDDPGINREMYKFKGKVYEIEELFPDDRLGKSPYKFQVGDRIRFIMGDIKGKVDVIIERGKVHSEKCDVCRRPSRNSIGYCSRSCIYYRTKEYRRGGVCEISLERVCRLNRRG